MYNLLCANLPQGESTCRTHLHFVCCRWVAIRVWLRRSPDHSGFERLKSATGIHPTEWANERWRAKHSWEPYKEMGTWFQDQFCLILEDQCRQIKRFTGCISPPFMMEITLLNLMGCEDAYSSDSNSLLYWIEESKWETWLCFSAIKKVNIQEYFGGTNLILKLDPGL